MNKSVLIEELASLLSIDSASIKENFVLSNLDNWDSLTTISLIGAIDQHCGVMVSLEEINRCKTWGDIDFMIDHKRQTAGHHEN